MYIFVASCSRPRTTRMSELFAARRWWFGSLCYARHYLQRKSSAPLWEFSTRPHPWMGNKYAFTVCWPHSFRQVSCGRGLTRISIYISLVRACGVLLTHCLIVGPCRSELISLVSVPINTRWPHGPRRTDFCQCHLSRSLWLWWLRNITLLCDSKWSPAWPQLKVA